MPNSKRKAHCNKTPHKTLLGAQITLKKTLARSKARGAAIVTALHAYACPYCPHFHVGRDRETGINWKVVEAENKRIEEIRKAASSYDVHKSGPPV